MAIQRASCRDSLLSESKKLSVSEKDQEDKAKDVCDGAIGKPLLALNDDSSQRGDSKSTGTEKDMLEGDILEIEEKAWERHGAIVHSVYRVATRAKSLGCTSIEKA